MARRVLIDGAATGALQGEWAPTSVTSSKQTSFCPAPRGADLERDALDAAELRDALESLRLGAHRLLEPGPRLS